MALGVSKKASEISPSLTLEISAMAAEMRKKGIDIIGFGVGEPDFETPQNIKDAAFEAINKGLTRYTPASGTVELRKAICDKLKKDNGLDYEPLNIIVSSGAKQSLYNAFAALLNPGDEVIVPSPYWVSYPEAVKLADGVPVLVETREENSFKFDIDDLKAAVNEKTKILILNSPANPTGAVYTEEELKEIADLAVEKEFYVVADEIYEKLIYEGKHISIASLGEQIKQQTIVINGVSKAYAMTGWRIGYAAVADHEIANLMGNIQGHMTSNPNSIAQYASIEALNGDQSEVEKMKVEFEKRRDFMYKRINEIEGLSCVEPKGAFYVMMNISKLRGKTINGYEIKDSLDFTRLLLEKGNVAVVPGVAFGNEDFVRLSYATSMEKIEEGLNRIENALKED